MADPATAPSEGPSAEEPRRSDRPEEETVGLAPALVDAVRKALAEGQVETVERQVEPLHPADTADLLEALGRDERKLLLRITGEALEAEVLTYLEPELRNAVVADLGPKISAQLLKQLESDDALEFFEDLDEDPRTQILSRVPRTIQRLLTEGMTFPEDSAGRLMQREVVVVPSIWTVGETIDWMRTHKKQIVSDFYDLYVVDPRYKPIGKLPLSRVLRSKRPTKIAELMSEDFYPLKVTLDQEEVAYLFRQYSLLSAPVVDDAGRLVGVITLDDIVHVIDQEAEEDILKLGGVSESDLYSDVLRTTRRRFSWLAVNLMTAITASLVIALFEATIEQVVALAVLMPIVASMGGNAGTQTLTVAVRAIAMKDLAGRGVARFITKELLVGLFNGLLFAVVMGVIAWLWFDQPLLGAVIAIAMVINLVVAGLFGALIPFLLDKLGADPAIGSSVFLTTVTDVVGFFAFLGLAGLVLL
ncbi:magnesium transporter [Algihabitans albus]|uniref:magnesium transporter n=1 Tax=Algihabitans albus TaxID=2164067 RepID=UPI0035D03B15